MSEPTPNLPDQGKYCPQCGIQFSCGANTPDQPCWCMGLPAIMPLPDTDAAGDCLCPQCLAKKMANQNT